MYTGGSRTHKTDRADAVLYRDSETSGQCSGQCLGVHLVTRATRRNEAPTRAIAGARTVTMATVRPNPPAHLLVLGIVMSEKTYTSRIRWLRAYYSDPLVNSGSAVLVRFVIEANWWARRIVEVPSSTSDDVLGVVTMSDLPQRHCAHKMVGWWRAAARWPAVFYGLMMTPQSTCHAEELLRTGKGRETGIPSTAAHAESTTHSRLCRCGTVLV